MVCIDPAKIDILYKLWRNRCFGRGHMLIDNVLKGFPKNRVDEFKEAIKEMVREGTIIVKKTKHGEAIFINPKKRIEIANLLKQYYEFL